MYLLIHLQSLSTLGYTPTSPCLYNLPIHVSKYSKTVLFGLPFHHHWPTTHVDGETRRLLSQQLCAPWTLQEVIKNASSIVWACCHSLLSTIIIHHSSIWAHRLPVYDPWACWCNPTRNVCLDEEFSDLETQLTWHYHSKRLFPPDRYVLRRSESACICCYPIFKHSQS